MEETLAFPIVASIAFVLVLLPVPWHWNARNWSTLLYVAWTSIGCLVYLVNSIIWHGNTRNSAPIWCDISAKLEIGFITALPAASLCINRRLYNISSIKQVFVSSKHKRRQTIIDFAIGLGVPCIAMALHYICQGHRFDIVEDIGCTPSTYVTPLTIPLVLSFAPVIGCVSLVYCCLSIRAFMKQRRVFNSLLHSNASHIDVSRYLRLAALAAMDILFSLPISVYFIWRTLRPGISPWVSWDDTHYEFSYVNRIDHEALKQFPGTWVALSINRWALPVAGLLFFLFFGLASEAFDAYRRAAMVCIKPFKRSPQSVSAHQYAYRLQSPKYSQPATLRRDLERGFNDSTFDLNGPDVTPISPPPLTLRDSYPCIASQLDYSPYRNVDFSQVNQTPFPTTSRPWPAYSAEIPKPSPAAAPQ